MTLEEKLESLAKTLLRYPELAAKMILDIGIDWDGKVLCNNDANDLEERLADCEKMVEKLVNEARFFGKD